MLKSKLLVIIMTIALVFTMCPVFGYAADSGTPQVTVKAVTKGTGKYKVTVSQQKVNYRNVGVKLVNLSTLKKTKRSKKVVKVKTSLSMYMDGKAVKTVSKTTSIKNIDSKTKTIKLYAPAYGKYKARVQFINSKGKVLYTQTLSNVGVVAREYNIAMLTATYGPLIFALQLYDQKDSEGNVTKSLASNTPTYIESARCDSINWKSLPKNVYANPLDNYPQNKGTARKINATRQYIKDLHQMNKNSKIHLYITDTYISGILDLCYGNGLTDKDFDVTMYSDGSGTFGNVRAIYNDANAERVLDKTLSEWEMAKKSYSKGKPIPVDSFKHYVKYSSDSLGRLALMRYALTAVNGNDNIKWVIGTKNAEVFGGQVTKPDGTKENTATRGFVDTYIMGDSDIIGVSLNNLLVGVKNTGNADHFKRFYNFSDEMFAKANNAGKKPMVLMGSRVPTEKNFEPFASFVIQYYGTKNYEYYYKGHPSTPTEQYPEKQAQLKRLGMSDITASIPAELILFFYPDVYCCGTSNSTLNSSYIDGHCKVFADGRTRAANKDTITAGDKFDIFMTPASVLTDSEEDAAIKALIPAGKECFLIEFVQEADIAKHEIAIFNWTDKTIKYYKLSTVTSDNTSDEGTPSVVINYTEVEK